MIQSQEDAYIASGRSLAAWAESLRGRIAETGITREEIAKLRALDEIACGGDTSHRPEWALMEEIVSGVTITVKEGHVDDPVGKDPRPRYLGSQALLNGMMQDLVREGAAVIVRGDTLDRTEPLLCLNAVHAADKADVRNGRCIWDSETLNDKSVVDATYRHFGVTDLPTVLDNARIFQLAVDKHGNADCCFGQADVKAAYRRLVVHSKSVPRTGQVLTDGLFLFWLKGFFGWCLWPMIWGVVSGVILFMCERYGKIKFLLSYVDDSTLITTLSRVDREMEVLLEVIRTLCGADAVAEEKTIIGVRALVVQGFLHDLDVDGGSVMMSTRNLEKSLFQLLSVPESWELDRNSIESIASRMWRASLVIPVLRPFVSSLFHEIHGLKRNIVKVLSEES